MSRYYDRDGNPMTLFEWARAFEDDEVRRVAHAKDADIEVSTVWLGLHQFGDGPPLIFETMIFGGVHDEEQWRYSSLDEAKRGHVRACELAFGVPA